MVLVSSQSLHQKSSFLPTISDNFPVLLNKISQQSYEELYEANADGTVSLEDTLNEVLAEFEKLDPIWCHRCYVWMTLILTLLVEPTVYYYQLINFSPKNMIILWLQNKNYTNSNNNINDDKLIVNRHQQISQMSDLLTDKNLGSFQTINECLDVFSQAIRVLNYNQSKEAILEILENCLEGYAIFPGSSGRRELLDWWLLEVVPASWYLEPPQSFYVVEGLPNREDIKLRQINTLTQISSAFWSSFP
jgi:hypothetical protein